jgi:DNA-binding NtrC family response regulator
LDLLYRLNSAQVHLPPLRERRGDIPLLAAHFLKAACSRQKKDVQGFSPDVVNMLVKMPFPGNVRELAQVVERASVVCDSGFILPSHLGEAPAPADLFSRRLCSLKENDDLHVVYVLNQTQGDRKQAAEILGITVRHLQRKLAEMKKDPKWKEVDL